MGFENKQKFALWIYPQTLRAVEQQYRGDNCQSKSEFIEKAIRFYLGYLNEEQGVNYLSPIITETVKAEIKGTEQRLARLLFKIAVELGKVSHLIAATSDIDDETLRRLQSMCANEVRRINGIISSMEVRIGFTMCVMIQTVCSQRISSAVCCRRIQFGI